MSRAFVSCLLASAAVMPACVADHGDESYVILSNLAGEVDENNVVTFSANPEGPFVSTGFFPTDFGTASVGSLVESRIDAPDGKESERTVFISGANITATVSPVVVNSGGVISEVGAVEVFEYQISFGAFVRPNQGLSAVLYDVVPPPIFAQIAAKVTSAGGDSAFASVDTTTTLIGEYYGERLDSLPFNFPVVITTPVPAP